MDIRTFNAMPEFVSDSVLYFVILASAYYAARIIPDHLNHIRNLAACPEPAGPGPRKQLQKDAEKAITVDTLRDLSDGYSYDLRASTIKIVASRTIKSRTKKLLLKDLASTDETRRYNAICGIWMMLYNPALRGKQIAEEFLDHRSFSALVTALKNVLSYHQPEQSLRLLSPGNILYPEPRLPASPVKVPIRPLHELCLMMILRTLLDVSRPYDKFSEHPDNITCALSAGLVTRWLKDYPFPCALPQNSQFNFKKSDVTNLFDSNAWASDDYLMAAIINDIGSTAMGKEQLRDAGLSSPDYNEEIGGWRQLPSRFDAFDSENDVRMTNGESTAGAATPPPIPILRQRLDADGEPRIRSQELSPEEEDLRRRRRQAMVVAEPGAPFSQQNILQRTDSGSAWRTDIENGISDNIDDTPTSSNPATPPIEITLSPATQEHFDLFTQPLRTDRAIIEQLRDEVIDDQFSDPINMLERLTDLVNQLHITRQRVRALIQDAAFPETERRILLRRVDRIVRDIIDDGDTQGTINRLIDACRGVSGPSG